MYSYLVHLPSTYFPICFPTKILFAFLSYPSCIPAKLTSLIQYLKYADIDFSQYCISKKQNEHIKISDNH